MQFIPDTSDGFQVFGFLRVVLNPTAETAYMHHNGIVIVIVIFLPYGTIQLPFGKDPFRIFHEVQKQLILLCAKLDWLPILIGAAFIFIY
jgi:hypothetical protein